MTTWRAELRPSLHFPDARLFELDEVNRRIRLPKLGWVKVRLSRPVAGEMLNVTVQRRGPKWFVVIQVKVGDTAPSLDVAPSLGIDLGLVKFAAMSDGATVEPLGAGEKLERKLRHAQKAVSRKQPGSSNRRKACAHVGRLLGRMAVQRRDWLHKLTTELADRHPVIAIEDLRVQDMSGSAKGTADAPGRRVRAKATLNRRIRDASWGEFARQLEYKLAARGGHVVRVNPAYTSRRCRQCGNSSAENRKTQAVFCCVACGHREDADLHAAKNIRAAGHAVWAEERANSTAPLAACGGEVSRSCDERRLIAVPAKQEPTGAEARV